MNAVPFFLKVRVILAIGAIIIGGGFLVAGFTARRAPATIATSPVEMRAITQEVFAAGTVKASGTLNLAVNASGPSFFIGLIARHFAGTWVFRVPAQAVVLALAVSALMGIIFGLFPARKAAKLSPIDALRYE